jgi:hypothetical protein
LFSPSTLASLIWSVKFEREKSCAPFHHFGTARLVIPPRLDQMKGGALMATTIRRIRKSVQKIVARAGLTPAQEDLFADVVQGICQTSSCHLSEIARALGENERLIVTEQRLSDGLARPSLDDDSVLDAYLHLVAPAARRMPFVVVDPTELVKPYGRAFENLDTVRDASDRRKPLEHGYWTVQIEATNEHNQTLPLLTQVFSTKAEGFEGWRETFANAASRVLQAVGDSAVWIFDRAFDGIEWMRICETLGLSWLIRQQQTRHICVATGATYDMRVFAGSLHRPHRLKLPYVDKKTHKRKYYAVQYGYVPVRVPDLDADLYLIVVQRPTREPLVLLTSVRIKTSRQAGELVLAYMRRWGVEDAIRSWKQNTGIEDFRVRNWDSIRRLVLCSMIACGLQALLLLTRPSVAQRFIARVKVFIADVLFRQYRLWAGIQDALLSGA